MASVSVSHLILFIASLLVAASVVGVFTESIGQVSQAIDERGVSVSENIRTDVTIISDSGSSAVYDSTNNTVTLHIKNTGTETLPAEADQIDVLVDGQFTTDVEVTVLGDAETWGPGEVVRVEITPQQDSLGNGDHRVKTIVNEDEEVFRFRL